MIGCLKSLLPIKFAARAVIVNVESLVPWRAYLETLTETDMWLPFENRRKKDVNYFLSNYYNLERPGQFEDSDTVGKSLELK